MLDILNIDIEDSDVDACEGCVVILIGIYVMN